MNGIALAVFISRLPKLFGISIERHGPLRDVLQLGLAILADEVNWYSSAVGGGCLALILLYDHEVVVFVVAVDKREGSAAYRKAAERLP